MSQEAKTNLNQKLFTVHLRAKYRYIKHASRINACKKACRFLCTLHTILWQHHSRQRIQRL